MTNDFISREEILKAFSDYVGSGMSMNDFDALWDIVAKMPAVKEPKWIPCSDKMPKNGTYLCTVCGWGGEYLQILGYSKNLYKVDEFDFWDKKGKAGFYELDSEYGFHEVHDVVAWMPLPEPYKAEGSGEE